MRSRYLLIQRIEESYGKVISMVITCVWFFKIYSEELVTTVNSKSIIEAEIQYPNLLQNYEIICNKLEILINKDT